MPPGDPAVARDSDLRVAQARRGLWSRPGGPIVGARAAARALRCEPAISTGRWRLGARLGLRPVLPDLPDHRRGEDERDDPHRSAG